MESKIKFEDCKGAQDFMNKRRAEFKHQQHISYALEWFDIDNPLFISREYINEVRQELLKNNKENVLERLKPLIVKEFTGKFNDRWSHASERESSELIALRLITDQESYGEYKINTLSVCAISEGAYQAGIYYCNRLIKN